MRVDADLIVVGGGPAGATAAIAAGRLLGRGKRILLLDRESFPRDKPCGGGISYRFYRRFPMIADEVTRRISVHHVHKVLVRSPAGEEIRAESSTPLYLMIRRREFDAALVAIASDLGVELVRANIIGLDRTSSTIRLSTRHGATFESPIVIGADGVHSVVATASRIRHRWTPNQLAIDTMEETPSERLRFVDPDLMFVIYGYRQAVGYGYVFPKAHHIDYGVGYLLSYFQEHYSADPPVDHHKRFFDQLAAEQLFGGTPDLHNFRAYLLPVDGPTSPSYSERLVVCGDAAGFVNGFTAEGIYYAMVSGEHAGTAAAEAIESGDCSSARLSVYEQRWQTEIGQELRFSVKIRQRLFRTSDIIDALIRAARNDERLKALFTGIALGEIRGDQHKRALASRLLRAVVTGTISLRTLTRMKPY